MGACGPWRITLFADHPGNDATDYLFVLAWLERWPNSVRVERCSTGGWEHVWDIEGPLEALKEVPKRFFCASAWADFPSSVGGVDHPAWATHLDDGKE